MLDEALRGLTASNVRAARHAAPPVATGSDQAAVRLAGRLHSAWQVLVTAPDAHTDPDGIPPSAVWIEAMVPGTALGALGAVAEGWVAGHVPALHDHDVWFVCTVDGRRGDKLRFLGLAGVCEIWLDRALVADSRSMFVSQTITIEADGEARLALRFKSLSRLMQRPRGRARWRTRLVTQEALRFHRQTLLGHMPGWCPPWHAVGPFRAVERLTPNTIEVCRLRTRMEGRDGVLRVELTLSDRAAAPADAVIRVGDRSAKLVRAEDGQFSAILRLPDVECWWPHTHGTPALHKVMLVQVEGGVASELELGRVGFRHLRLLDEPDGKGFALEINGARVFCRGACWTSANLATLEGERDSYESWLRLACAGGLNMIRIGGTMLYEATAFHQLCDELGLLVWQDLMFANMDYPLDAEPLRGEAVLEVEQLLERLAGSPSLAVICGGSEMAQQATMLGLPADRRRMEFFEATLPDLVQRLRPDVLCVPHSPWGSPLPISVGSGVAHYYGVGGYRRPIEDARRANVRFASECLALANPPCEASPASPHLTRVPQDPGASWDFADIRDHYLGLLYDVDPARLRLENSPRYWNLSRAVTADLMEAVVGEWRRPGSSCAGAMVWQFQDLVPGSGWGLIDSYGVAKPAYHGLRRVTAPVQVLLSDEGVDGLGLHILNETSVPVPVRLELVCLKRGSVAVASAERLIDVPPRGAVSLSSQTLLDGFFDITRAFRFGPPEHDISVATIRCAASGAILSDAFHFPLGRALPEDDLGLSAVLLRDPDGWALEVSTRRFAQAVHLIAQDYRPDADWFHLAPGRTRRVSLRSVAGAGQAPRGLVDALNARRSVPFRAEGLES